MTARALVAGVGNVFFGDDGFGVEVARRLSSVPLPAGVVVRDVGVRGIHLAFELLDPVELLVVVDLAPRGGKPGELYVIEPDVGEVPSGSADAHDMDLASVLAALRTMGGAVPRVRVVGCEPARVGAEMALSEPVRGAVDRAADLVREVLLRELRPAGNHDEEVET